MIAQETYVPFSEARQAVNSFKEEDTEYDSLRGIYEKKWLLEFTYGQRFINSNNRSALPDTITFADFTKKRGFFGADVGYFLKSNLYIGVGLALTLLSRSEEISSISFGSGGISGEGKGNGGAMVHIGVVGKYYFTKKLFNRPYVALELGQTNLFAKGGSVSFNSSNGQTREIQELRASLPTGQLSLGMTFRATPVWLIDLNAGYLQTKRGSPIAGITSPGGFTTSVSMQFILNARKE